MIFLGIDPGLSGAVAQWRPADRKLTIHDMPTLRVTPGSAKRTIDAIELARIVDEITDAAVTLAVIEQAGARPKEGLASAHKNGVNWGVAYGVLCANFLPVEIVSPQSWKRDMRCPSAKDSARARASQLLPEHAGLWSRVKDDGRAEAALIALYAERRHRFRAVTP